MAAGDKIKVQHMNGTMDITVTPAGGEPTTITVGEGAQARWLRGAMVIGKGQASENETEFPAV